jgi:hypothetical protein
MLYAYKEIEKKTNDAERKIVETTIILSSNHQAQPPIHDDEGLTLDYWGQSPLHHVRAAPPPSTSSSRCSLSLFAGVE